ncbi:MAG: GTPase RsgA, partial [Micrococcales bacterium]|nr:GTPase RsgA [Micrococcales bacterium]
MSRGDWRRLDEGDVRHRPNPRGSRPRTKVRPEHAQAQVGRVVRVDRGRYRVVLDGPKAREVIAMQARELGRASIVVGDVVHVVGDTSGAEGSLARVVRVAPRTSVLRRSADDTDPSERVIVAGADQLVVVTALADPPPRPRLIDRCLVAAYDAGLDAVVCLTKADLEDDGELRALYEPLGVRVVATSVVGGSGGAGESATQGTPSCDKSVVGGSGGAGESATQGTPSCDKSVVGGSGGAGESATQ